MKKLTSKQKIDRVYAMAEAFENQLDAHRMCIHEQVDATAVLLSRLVRCAMEHEGGEGTGAERVDDLLSWFAGTLSACTGPCANDDPMRGVDVKLTVTAADNEFVP